METVEFQTHIEHGTIAVPTEYQHKLTDGDRVIVTVVKQPPRSQPDLIAQLTENPVKVNGFLTRAEIYDRHL